MTDKITLTIGIQKNIALIAHDGKKAELKKHHTKTRKSFFFLAK